MRGDKTSKMRRRAVGKGGGPNVGKGGGRLGRAWAGDKATVRLWEWSQEERRKTVIMEKE